MTAVVKIVPRTGVTADEIVAWLSENFQIPCDVDAGPSAVEERRIRGGNPLVNAWIEVTDDLD